MNVAKTELETLRASSGSNAEQLAAAAALDRETLLKAQNDLTAIQDELAKLHEAHAAALKEASDKLAQAQETCRFSSRLPLSLYCRPAA